MAQQLREEFANNVATTLNGAITNVATSLVVTAATGFPAAVAGISVFRILVESEILIVTATSTTTFTVTRGAEGTTAAAHATGVAVTHVLTSGALTGWVPSTNAQPRHHALLAWSYDVVMATGAAAIPVAGVVYYCKCYLPVAATITNLCAAVITTPGVTLTNCFAGLYTSAGVQVGVTANQATVWTTTGVKVMALTTPYAAAGGPDVFYWVALLVGSAATLPAFGRASGAAVLNNANLVAADGYRYGSAGSALTALPASLTPSTMASAGNAYWVGMS